MGIYHDQVIEAAYLHTKPGVFYIGPFARRVSFASQQHRALDLVAALKMKKKLVHPATQRPKTIAIIGAGIAGITIASALRGEECVVHLYEREKEPLLLQSGASHRLIHPTISRWPQGEIELTTRFSFLDWFAATADKVIAYMRREWDDLLSPAPDDEEFRFFNEVAVTEIFADRGSVRLQVDTKRTDLPAWQRYDYVFVTTGFAEEETLDSQKLVSYWTEDKIEEWRCNQRKVYVSGCGDGGLIDALRLIHADFDKGWLAIRLAELLKGHFDDEIIDAENNALMAAKSLACMELVNGDSGGAGANNRKIGARYENDQIVKELSDFYMDLVKQLPDAARELLDQSATKANVATGKVTLISRQTAPFGPYAAPIHKIMIAHAIEFGPLLYRQGELQAEGKRTFVEWIVERTREELDDATGLVVRHGSPANLAGLASLADSNSLRIRQFMLADYIDVELERAIVPPANYPDRATQLSRFIGVRRPMAAELVDSILPGATVTANGAGYIYEPAELPPLGRKGIGIKMPPRLFDIELRPGEMIDIDFLG